MSKNKSHQEIRAISYPLEFEKEVITCYNKYMELYCDASNYVPNDMSAALLLKDLKCNRANKKAKEKLLEYAREYDRSISRSLSSEKNDLREQEIELRRLCKKYGYKEIKEKNYLTFDHDPSIEKYHKYNIYYQSGQPSQYIIEHKKCNIFKGTGNNIYQAIYSLEKQFATDYMNDKSKLSKDICHEIGFDLNLLSFRQYAKKFNSYRSSKPYEKKD